MNNSIRSGSSASAVRTAFSSVPPIANESRQKATRVRRNDAILPHSKDRTPKINWLPTTPISPYSPCERFHISFARAKTRQCPFNPFISVALAPSYWSAQLVS